LDSNWPCIETRGSFFFLFFHFDLVLRREGRKFWIEVTLYWDERVVFVFILTLYRDERVVNFGLKWPCTETRGSFFFFHFDLLLRREGRKFWIEVTFYWDERIVFVFILTFYWDERVVNFGLKWPCTETRGSFFFHFDLVLRRESNKFWIEVTLYWDERVVNFGLKWPCTKTRGSLFFILTLY